MRVNQVPKVRRRTAEGRHLSRIFLGYGFFCTVCDKLMRDCLYRGGGTLMGVEYEVIPYVNLPLLPDGTQTEPFLITASTPLRNLTPPEPPNADDKRYCEELLHIDASTFYEFILSLYALHNDDYFPELCTIYTELHQQHARGLRFEVATQVTDIQLVDQHAIDVSDALQHIGNTIAPFFAQPVHVPRMYQPMEYAMNVVPFDLLKQNPTKPLTFRNFIDATDISSFNSDVSNLQLNMTFMSPWANLRDNDTCLRVMRVLQYLQPIIFPFFCKRNDFKWLFGTMSLADDFYESPLHNENFQTEQRAYLHNLMSHRDEQGDTTNDLHSIDLSELMREIRPNEVYASLMRNVTMNPKWVRDIDDDYVDSLIGPDFRFNHMIQTTDRPFGFEMRFLGSVAVDDIPFLARMVKQIGETPAMNVNARLSETPAEHRVTFMRAIVAADTQPLPLNLTLLSTDLDTPPPDTVSEAFDAYLKVFNQHLPYFKLPERGSMTPLRYSRELLRHHFEQSTNRAR